MVRRLLQDHFKLAVRIDTRQLPTQAQGTYDLDAQWEPAPGPPGAPVPVIGPGIFTAMEEQLGLGLASETGPVPFLVIERMEKPAGN